MSSTTGQFIGLALRLAVAMAGTYLSVRMMMKMLDPSREAKEEAKKKVAAILQNIDLPRDVEMNEYEMRIAAMLVPPQNGIDWADIGGCDNLINELRQRLVLPLQLMQSNARQTSLLSPSKGILLHGPPGCGKTLMARAVAKAVDARFIELDIAVLTDKWYGESQKLVSALFSFARKVEPTIIFIDEIDTFLRDRQSSDNETTSMMKAQFMTQWDGFTNSDAQVVVMGATNCPGSIDAAIYRRMPMRFCVPLPDMQSRLQILKVILKDEYVDELNLEEIAQHADGLSGSDLKEVCRTAALRRLSHNFDTHNRIGEVVIRQQDLIDSVDHFRGHSRYTHFFESRLD
uniref:AAA domain-containing protein n=1 Tax=Panagrellus redivivus TaxID=6233 RepID=A0A7E4V236_PANRE